MDDEEFWGNDPKALQNTEWEKISNDFTNAGYREGITAGKEGALQEGFDDGFASVGAPLGRDLGILRGLSSALLAFLSRAPGPPSIATDPRVAEVRAIATELSNVRLSDIAPPDLQALAHAREHLDGEGRDRDARMDDEDDVTDPAELNEALKAKRDMESLEDLMAQMGGVIEGAGADARLKPARPTAEDVARLKERLLAIARELGLGIAVQWS
ncbi:hypothetical protein BD309DRAFT_855223 [Dichomitus squalens]|uniref:Protein YAE1 n=1 Tax=Dichomitus squalens TaxID=114155 RepID=A0A4Q9Q4R9_9APHY|nr:uncharacterized protein DICSQDRAFT_168252 [Dichomitus squalens LYAD-421 SS1]EJF63369.1 hypothetical protein DICSQDRAFT_168252 [Dichomitus squalens LYAD-421 SS1]TBU24071.1 hypothetical protein BD311DRAFT_672576 [Dichomitus squalens]TBU47799.1 hypothetical protein BD309DRAFT_855223 [Dichomitus squalens]TBU62373.1 hypothetical protein BD310DRAFT_811186 [Dichomitus squalens]